MGINTSLKQYIFEIRKISIKKAAAELGCSHKYLGTIANGARSGGKLADTISEWSNGYVSIASLIRPINR